MEMVKEAAFVASFNASTAAPRWRITTNEDLQPYLFRTNAHSPALLASRVFQSRNDVFIDTLPAYS